MKIEYTRSANTYAGKIGAASDDAGIEVLIDRDGDGLVDIIVGPLTVLDALALAEALTICAAPKADVHHDLTALYNTWRKQGKR